MILTNNQEQGLKIAVDRYKANEAYTVIAGYAGSGKTTLIKFIVSALGLYPSQVAYIAYTGKAAQVLKNKGCSEAMTAHRLLYKSVQRSDGSFIHIPYPVGSLNYKMIVVDEISMLPKTMWDLLLSHKIYVLATGDPGQLPAIGESTDVLDHPHIFLDEIMRQAEDSEIIRLSVDVRENKPLRVKKGTEINIIKERSLCDGMLTWADQIICGKNSTRYYINDYFRKMKWGEQYRIEPIVGDKVICLKNNWDKIIRNGDALVNGTTGTIKYLSVPKENRYLEKECFMDFLPEEYEEDTSLTFDDILIDWKLITAHEPTLNKDNFRYFPKKLRPELFDYGYCVTCWKAQGSEYNKVLFFAEKVGYMSKENYKRFIYTGITRASKRLTLILPE